MVEQFLPSFSWFNPTRVYFGVGELDRLSSHIDELGGSASRVFLVTGRSSLRARGILQEVLNAIGEQRVTLFDQVTPFPSPQLVNDAAQACRDANADIVVAIGGGSAMDLAKAVAILATNEGDSWSFAIGEKKLENRGLPFIAVPTTSGSSSEVTSGAALWDMDNKRQMGLSSPLMFPDVAIVDPEMTMTMSKGLAAVTGMDAFTSAFESYWSLEAEPIADAIDLEVIRIFNMNLDRSCIQGDIESRANCAMAATMSGIAYSNSHPNVCHAVGTPLTLYWGVEHGQAVGLTLATFLRWNAQSIPHKLTALYDALGVSDIDAACARITRIMERCGLATTLSGLDLGEPDIETIVEHTRWDRTGVLPRPLEKDDLRGMLHELI